jgi:hypothetical protein
LTFIPLTLSVGGSLLFTTNGSTMRIQSTNGTAIATQTIPALPTNTWVPVLWKVTRKSATLADIFFELNGNPLWAYDVGVTSWANAGTLYYLSASGTTWLLDDVTFGDSVGSDDPMPYVTCVKNTLSAGTINEWALVGGAVDVADAVLEQDSKWIQSQPQTNSKQALGGIVPAPNTSQFFGANILTRFKRAVPSIPSACKVGVRLPGNTDVVSASLTPSSGFNDLQSVLLYKTNGAAISPGEAAAMQIILKTGPVPPPDPPVPANPSWWFDVSNGSMTLNGSNQMTAWADSAGQTSVGIVGTINTEVGPGGYRVPIFTNGATTYLTKPSQPGIRTVYALVRHNSAPHITGWWGVINGVPEALQLTGAAGQYLYTCCQVPAFVNAEIYQNNTQITAPTTTVIPLNTWFLVTMVTSAGVDVRAFFTDRVFNRNFDGRVALLLGYTAVHGAAERAAVINYCNTTFGLSL